MQSMFNIIFFFFINHTLKRLMYENESSQKNVSKNNIVPDFIIFWTSEIRHPHEQIDKELKKM